MDIILSWLDLLWIPAVFLMVGKKHWIKAIVLVLACIFTLRLQIDLMESINYPRGIFSVLDYPLLYRGYIIYGVCLGLFLALSAFSKKEDSYVYLAAAITIYFTAFCVSSVAFIL